MRYGKSQKVTVMASTVFELARYSCLSVNPAKHCGYAPSDNQVWRCKIKHTETPKPLIRVRHKWGRAPHCPRAFKTPAAASLPTADIPSIVYTQAKKGREYCHLFYTKTV